MSSQKNKLSISIPVFPLTFLFVLLKVFGKVSWSWWVVFSPLWAPALAVLGIVSVVFLITLVVLTVQSLAGK